MLCGKVYVKNKTKFENVKFLKDDQAIKNVYIFLKFYS